MNVTELARQLKTTRHELLAKLPELGFAIGQKAIKVDNLVAEKIKAAWAAALRRERLLVKMQDRQAAVERSEKEESGRKKEIAIPETITVSDLSSRLQAGVAQVIGYLMKNGVMASLNQKIDFETAAIVASDYGFQAVAAESVTRADKETGSSLRAFKQTIAAEPAAEPRPPVVVVMGHIDHGKTTLLDAIRETNVAAGESGGITQHIGAYQVEVPPTAEPKSRAPQEAGRGIPRLITFLDTPGHEAFAAMRERGGQVADVAILVVAADDGLKPQTLESIKVIEQEGLPFLVAINKIDKPGADIDRVKKELAEINLGPEDWGGKTICVPISAKQKQNLSELLEMVLLLADLEKFSANPHRPGSGVIIEAHIDRGEGPVATVLVSAGTLRVGDEVVIGNTYGRIKALKDWRGHNVAAAPPAMPVKILGLKAAPAVGEILQVAAIDRSLRKQVSKDYRFVETKPEVKAKETSAAGASEPLAAQVKLKLVIKADVLGSLEALTTAIRKLARAGVEIVILRQGLGNITEADIALAESTAALILGFNVALSAEARKASFRSSAEIKTYKVIYELLDEVKKRAQELIKVALVEVPQGEILVLRVFKDSRTEAIIGGRVLKAKVTNLAKFRQLRQSELLDEGKILELQQNKQTMDEVKEGVECGVRVAGVRGFKEGDVLACYIEEEHQSQ